MSDWEIRHLNSEIKYLKNRLESLEKEMHKQLYTTNFNTFLWLMLISNILFWFCIAHFTLRHDINKIQLQQKENISNVVDTPKKNKNN